MKTTQPNSSAEWKAVMTKSILLVGVGGQGTILASKLLTTGLMQAGYDVKMSEIHGMSQRGGSVSSQVRYGDTVYSPVIELGGADLMVSFEQMEALRWLEYLKPNGKIIVNNHKIPSMPMISKGQEYPDTIIEQLKDQVDTTVINGAEEAEKLGNAKVMNVILLGATVQKMELTHIDWHSIIAENVKPQFIALNQKAFDIGLSLA